MKDVVEIFCAGNGAGERCIGLPVLNLRECHLPVRNRVNAGLSASASGHPASQIYVCMQTSLRNSP